MIYEEEDNNDFFDGPEIPEAPKEPKRPKLTPDDPEYWEQPEDEFEHLRPRRPRRERIWWWVGLSAVVVGVLIGLWVRYFVPVVVSATESGYVDEIHKSTSPITSYEGLLLPYKNLMDTLRPYEGDFRFSTKNSEVATDLKRAHLSNRPVRVYYEIYRTPVFWRGETRVTITGVDTVDPRYLLPPDRQPEFVRNPK